MISRLSYIIYGKTGFGHAARLAAIVRMLRTILPVNVDIFANEAVWPVIESLVSPPDIRLKPFDYIFLEKYKINGALLNDREKELFFRTNVNHTEEWRNSVIFTDFVKHALYIKHSLNRPLLGLVHSNLTVTQNDTEDVLEWKHFLLKTAEGCDVVFHSTIDGQSPPLPNIISVPIIARTPTRSSDEIRRDLGLKSGENYVLYYWGESRGLRSYPYHGEILQSFKQCNLPFKLVIMYGVSPGRHGIYRDDDDNILVYNESEGQDYVQSANFVISKPGMSIFSECISLGVPLLMCSGADGETRIREAAYQRILPDNTPIISDFSPASLERNIDNILSNRYYIRQRFQEIQTNGAEVVAHLLIEVLKLLSVGFPVEKLANHFRSLQEPH